MRAGALAQIPTLALILVIAAEPAAACVGMGLHPSLLCRIDEAGYAKDDCARMLARQIKVRIEKYASQARRAERISGWLSSLIKNLSQSPRTIEMGPIEPGQPFLIVWGVDLVFMVNAPDDERELPDAFRVRAGFDENLTKIEMIPGTMIAGGYSGNALSAGGNSEIAVAVIPISRRRRNAQYEIRTHSVHGNGIGGVVYINESAEGSSVSLGVKGGGEVTCVELPNRPGETITNSSCP